MENQIYCEIHPNELVERVCSMLSCKKLPFLCWQCTIDDVEHSKSHRQHICKLSEFVTKIEQSYIELNDSKVKEKEEAPQEITSLIEEQSANILNYYNNVDEQKIIIRNELQEIVKKFEEFCMETADNFDQQLDKQTELFEQQYDSLRDKFDQRYGLSEVPTLEIINDQLDTLENTAEKNKYLNKLKQDLLPKGNLVKDTQFIQMYQKLRNKVDKPITFRKNDYYGKQIDQVAKQLKQEVESIQQLFQRTIGNPTIIEADQSTLIAQSPTRDQKDSEYQQQQQQNSFQFNPILVENQEQSIMSQNQTIQNSSDFQISLAQKVKTGHSKSINCLIVINNEMIATGSKDKLIKIYKTYTYEHIATFEAHQDTVCALGTVFNIQQNKTYLVSGGGNFDSSIIVWDLEAKEPLHQIKGHQSSVTSIIDLEDNYHVASGSYDNMIIIWNYQSGKASFVLRKHGAMISHLRLFSDKQYLASASWDKVYIKYSELQNNHRLPKFLQGLIYFQCLDDLIPGVNLGGVMLQFNSIVIWRMQYNDQKKITNCVYDRSIIEDYAILSLGVSKFQSHLLYYSGTSKLIKIYNINLGKKEQGFDGSQYGVNEIQILEKDPFQSGSGQDGCYILGLSSNIYSLRIWDSSNGQLVGVVKDSDTLVMNNFNTTPKMNVICTLDDEVKLAVINSSDTNNFFTIWNLVGNNQK